VKLVVLDSLFASLELEREVAREYGDELVAWDGTTASLADADVVAHVRTRVDAELIAAMPHCRVIARFGTGLDTIDVEAACTAGIDVVGVRDYCLLELASQTLMLAFALVRRLGETPADTSWDQVAASTPMERRANALVVGLGAVGTRVHDSLAALGYEVTGISRTNAASLDDALAAADLVFLTPALTPETNGMIDKRRLAGIKRGAILVNTARLALLDEEAVTRAVESGVLGGLGLDASLPPTSPLRRVLDRPNVLVTPHVGWFSRESAAELRRRTIAGALRAAHRHDELEVRNR
jgi:D-3-phosphoglycerate dehydrogenase / 2-oxoglutarate reductase